MYETKRLRLVPFTEKDINDPVYRSWFMDQNVTKFNSHGLFPKTMKGLLDFSEGLGSERLVLKIIVNEIDWWIGNVSLQSFNWINRSAEFAIVIGNIDFWGKGYATESLILLLEHGFNKMNFNRIWTGTAATNIGMQNVAKKLGMTWEGSSRQGMFLEGKYVSVMHYGILREEWNERLIKGTYQVKV